MIRSVKRPARLAAVELGGTHALVALGSGMEIVEQHEFLVGQPAETLTLIADQLRHWNAQAPIAALGVASFGPIRVDPSAPDYGRMLATPKPGWSHADVLGTLSEAVSGPAVLHTDVTAAALAEGRWGAAQGCTDHIYITIGTGVGIGLIAGGRPVVGTMHPEGGHLLVRRQIGDAFAGACPFHGDCLEGLISGPALTARCGYNPASISDDDPIWTPFIDALAAACATLFGLLAPQKIVIGGGVVRQRQFLIAAAAERCGDKLAGYLPFFATDRIVAAALPEAGLRGALLLAQEAK